jgi:hypothetical protein
MNALGVRERTRYGPLMHFIIGNYKSDVCHLSNMETRELLVTNFYAPALAGIRSRSIFARDNFNSVIKEELKRSNPLKSCKLQMETMRQTPDYVYFIFLVINSR